MKLKNNLETGYFPIHISRTLVEVYSHTGVIERVPCMCGYIIDVYYEIR